MADTQQQQQQPNYQSAHSLLVNQIYAPVFFEKLAADYGIQPSNEQEAQELMTLAGKLQQLDEVQRAKAASSRSTIVSAANQGLDKVLNGMGVQTSSNNSYAEAEIKEAAAQLAQIPQVRDAALLYQDALQQLVS